MHDILWLGDALSRDVGLVGAKAANLSVYFERHAVPPGFVVPALPAAWTALPEPLRLGIASAYAMLGQICGIAAPSVAVRSSAIDEDGAGSSFAGQHDTYLNIVGEAAVVDAVLRCMNSALCAEAVAYRRQKGLPLEDIRIAVLVQQLVPADASAVVFSCNPVSGADDEIMINANWGLGESIVGGAVTPDTFIVSKGDDEILDRMIAEKTHMTVRDAAGTHDEPVAEPLQREPSLTDDQILSLKRLVMSLESSSGHPVDIECAIAGGTVYLLQCRPITTL